MSITKTTKRLLAVFAALVMALAVAVPAFAATITINGNQGETYTVYKVLDVTTTVSGDGYNYTTESESVANLFKQQVTDATVTESSAGGLWYISWSAEDADDLVKYLAGLSETRLEALFGEAAGEVTLTSGIGGIDELEPGYYFVTSTVGSMCMLRTATDTAIVEDKNEEPTVEKKVDQTNAQIGDTVTYTVTIDVPADTEKLSLSDTLSNGLTLNNTSFKIAIDDEEPTDLTVSNITNSEDGTTTFTVDLTSYLTGEDCTIVVTYTATINEKAISTNPATNKAEVSYGNNSTSTSSTATTSTHKITISKIDGKTNESLDGAEFQLQDANGNVIYVVEMTNGSYRVATEEEIYAEESVATTTIVVNGSATIDGLDSDVTYSLVETKAPDGYNLLTSAESVTVSTDNTTKVEVKNYAGSLLPSTGGMGTTVLYAVGAALVIGAGVTLVVRRRMGSNA